MTTRKPTFVERAGRPTTVLRSGLALPDYLKPEGNSFKVDIGKLPLPTESYVANVGWAERSGTTVSIFLGNRDRNDKTRLKTRLEFRFAAEAFLNFWNNSQDFFASLRALVDKVPSILDGLPGDNPATFLSEKDHVASSSIAIMTHSGTQAEIDFFDLPATDIFLFFQRQESRRLEIHPILRVYTSTSVLWTILNSSQSIADEVEPQVSKLLEATGKGEDHGGG